MAGDRSNKRSRRTKTDKPSRKTKKNTPKGDKEGARAPGGFQRLEQDQGVDKMPSNAPTMAIAPSDYEHIYHENTGAPTAGHHASAPTSPTSPPLPTPPQPPRGTDLDSRRARSPQIETGRQMSPLVQSPQAAAVSGNSYELQVTPDGYTLLGQQPLDMNNSNARRVAFPSHIVRANNQFSRAALARVAKYLASRAEL